MAFRVTQGDARKHLAANRRQPILDLWWHVHGEIPPISGADRFEERYANASPGLRGCYACFRGLMRPVGVDDHGFDYVAFVSKPRFGFRYEPSMACLISDYDVPNDVVFVNYARLDFPEGRAYHRKKGKAPPTEGVVTHWQFVECDPDDPMLPINHETRFRRRLW